MEQIFTDIGIYLLQMVVFIAVIYVHFINYFKSKTNIDNEDLKVIKEGVI